MKSVSIQTNEVGLESELAKLKSIDAQIILVFSSNTILENSSVIPNIRAALPNARIMGCSTAGEIGESVEDDSITLMGMTFEKTRFEFTAVQLAKTEDSYQAGVKIARNLKKDDLRAIFVLTPGLSINGSELTLGLREHLSDNVYVSGGLAGDGTHFKHTCVVLDDGISDKQAVAFGLYGDNIVVNSGSSGGWKPFGPLRRVTRAEKNILFELDGKPALALYKEYLGDKVEGLPGSGLLYPFAIMDENRTDTKGLIRTILGINEEQNSLILAGNMETGSLVSLMHAGTDELAEGARQAAVKALNSNTAVKDSAAICVSCVGRKILMGDDTIEELDAVRENLKATPIAGFYSYGEISHHEDTNAPELHNQTMTITYITENVA